MKVFISWSGARSKAFAETLREWLPTIIQSLEPFVSTQDIPPGGRGLNVLASELERCCFGILCLTQDNKQQPWINFEAGALSKVIEASRVVPLLLDLRPNDITGPLTQFQAIDASNRDEVFKLVKALSEQDDEPRIAERVLRRTFDTFWSELETKISELQRTGKFSQGQEVRNDRDILEEVLTLSRRTERELSRIMQTRDSLDEDLGPTEATAPTSTSRRHMRTGIGLSELLLPELQQLAQQMGIPGTNRMRKSHLIAAIQERQARNST